MFHVAKKQKFPFMRVRKVKVNLAVKKLLLFLISHSSHACVIDIINVLKIIISFSCFIKFWWCCCGAVNETTHRILCENCDGIIIHINYKVSIFMTFFSEFFLEDFFQEFLEKFGRKFMWISVWWVFRRWLSFLDWNRVWTQVWGYIKNIFRPHSTCLKIHSYRFSNVARNLTNGFNFSKLYPNTLRSKGTELNKIIKYDQKSFNQLRTYESEWVWT